MPGYQSHLATPSTQTAAQHGCLPCCMSPMADKRFPCRTSRKASPASPREGTWRSPASQRQDDGSPCTGNLQPAVSPKIKAWNSIKEEVTLPQAFTPASPEMPPSLHATQGLSPLEVACGSEHCTLPEAAGGGCARHHDCALQTCPAVSFAGSSWPSIRCSSA